MQKWSDLIANAQGSGTTAARSGTRIDALVLTLVGANLLFNIIANACFKVSAFALSRREFLAWQVIGNLSGLITVVTLTALLRFIPLHTAFVVTTGLAVIGVQVVAASLVFREPITSAQWLGTALVVMGIALVGAR
jgi:multidrug transporter EmrE-like cation transporter